jgi:hypothetical protein
MLDSVVVGADIRVSGQWNGHALIATHVEPRPLAGVFDRTDRAVIEGIAHKNSANHLNIQGNTVQIDKAQKVIYEGQRIRVEMHRGKEGQWIADRIENHRQSMIHDTQPNISQLDDILKSENKASLDSGLSDRGSGSGSSGRGSGGGSGSSGRSGSGSSGRSGSGSSSGGRGSSHGKN